MTDRKINPRRFYVYALFREDGTPFYIGKGKRSRWRDHERVARPNYTPKDTIILRMKAAGYTEIPKEKLITGLTDDEAKKIEIDLIRLVGRKPIGPLVNLTDGGEGVSNLPPESLERIRLANTGRVRSPESRKRQSDAMKGVSRGPHSEETKVKIAKKATGRLHSAETKEIIRKINKGKKHSNETKQKMSSSHSGFRHTDEAKEKIRIKNTGKTHSAETREKLRFAATNISDETRIKMSIANSGRVISDETKEKKSKSMIAIWEKKKSLSLNKPLRVALIRVFAPNRTT